MTYGLSHRRSRRRRRIPPLQNRTKSKSKSKTIRNNSYISTEEIKPENFFAKRFSLIKATRFLQRNGGEMVSMTELKELNSHNILNNYQLTLLYKIVNIIYLGYTTVKISWAEWLILTVEGRDMLYEFVSTPAKFIIFISAFYFLPKDNETMDWFFSHMAHYMVEHSYTSHMIRLGIVSQNKAWIAELFSSKAVRKGGTALIDAINSKLGKDSDTIIKNKINNTDVLTKEDRRELLELYGVIKRIKDINTNTNIRQFIHFLMDEYYTDARRIGKIIIKSKQRNNRTIKSMNPLGKLN